MIDFKVILEGEFMKCEQCGYDEDKGTKEFVGIFANGVSFTTTDGELCGIYGCPNCNTVQFTTNIGYINYRKEIYKERMRAKSYLD